MMQKSLKNHIDYEHENKEREKYTCVECNKTFMSKSSLSWHTNVHQGVTFSCDKCPYTSSSRSSLKFHEKNNHEKQEIAAQLLSISPKYEA